jgi:acetate kinase
VRILVVNAGSSSLKLRMLGGDDSLVVSIDLPAPGGRGDDHALADAVRELGPVDAVGHRIVHGGARFTSAVVIDQVVREELEKLTDLAPLHQPRSLAALDAVSRALPEARAVACFDTAFHATMPPAAATYALPAEWRKRWGLRRFGFHGLSHAYASGRAAELLGQRPRPLRIVTCHLGAGASLAAVLDGRSVETTMGFTPLDGLVMATRSGSVDPGLLLWLELHAGLSAAELSDSLEHASGLTGLTGLADMREVLAAAAAGDDQAALGLDVYLHRLSASIAAMAASLGGLDALVFTGGVGENAPTVRARAAEGLGFLRVAIDRARNETGEGDRRISPEGAAVITFVIEAREDLQIAREVRQLLG